MIILLYPKYIHIPPFWYILIGKNHRESAGEFILNYIYIFSSIPLHPHPDYPQSWNGWMKIYLFHIFPRTPWRPRHRPPRPAPRRRPVADRPWRRGPHRPRSHSDSPVKGCWIKMIKETMVGSIWLNGWMMVCPANHDGSCLSNGFIIFHRWINELMMVYHGQWFIRINGCNVLCWEVIMAVFATNS